MSKIGISLKILNILLDENIHKTDEISEKVEIPKRIVRWYINGLLEAGMYIESFTGRYGGYVLKKEYFQNNVYKLLTSKSNIKNSAT
ncbi:Rrf2 family transcriptional regulator [Clostridium tyrobutyricum]|uniref:Rrf2 family transcriptional regulator n=1 Tax=Clostridium tyrobutyricum TaxID=1519 RepID=UPI0010AA8C32|nr:Rrf2 family transcriptional regulator [Clostridium tyrobutyricum]MBR9648008.1 Rrf2 family transcriptional regulator [Clostridium tyrobutyricum]MBV4450977.1 Rrf2 family transcriptional regulator [Clostridium tyrobutyricum]QCH27095.1 Transcriptional regulator [Clostridium tyrobutyricum]